MEADNEKMNEPVVVWEYQEHFCFNLESFTKELLKHIGYSGNAKCYIVCVRGPKRDKEEPKTFITPLENQISELFNNILSQIEDKYRVDERHRFFYSNDPIGSEKKPENIRLDTVTTCIHECFSPFDVEHNTMTFCGIPHNIKGYYVVPII